MPDVFLKKLDELRTELVDLAFTLERRGRHEAADVALTTSARVGEIHDELRVRAVAGAVTMESGCRWPGE